MGSKNYKDI